MNPYAELQDIRNQMDATGKALTVAIETSNKAMRTLQVYSDLKLGARKDGFSIEELQRDLKYLLAEVPDETDAPAFGDGVKDAIDAENERKVSATRAAISARVPWKEDV